MTELKIPAKHFRKFEDPFIKSPQDDKPVKYRFYAKVGDIPEELLNWMSTNPRDQTLNSDVAKAIRASLLDENNPRFHLWNRGILISAEKVIYDNRVKVATIVLEDYQIHGNIDGGHTLRVILKAKEDARKKEEQYPNQYVEMEIITGLDFPETLAEARNTSNAVDLKSMEELRRSFDVLKEILEPCMIDGDHYIERIEFRQNQMRDNENAIDIREVISIINMFNQILYPNTDPNATAPIQSFSGKEIGLKKFLKCGLDDKKEDDEYRAVREENLRKMAPIIPGIFELWDHIERHFAEATSQLNKRYGSRKYSNFDKKSRSNAMFSNVFINQNIVFDYLFISSHKPV